MTITHQFPRIAAQCFVAGLVLTSLTIVSYRLQLNLSTASLLFVIVVVLVSRVGSSVSSIFASIVAALCLAHLAPPAFSFRIDDPLDDVAVVVFLITSLIITRLMSTVRRHAEEARSSVSYRVIEAEERERQRIAKDLHENIGQRVTMLLLQIDKLNRESFDAADARSQLDELQKQSSEILTDVKALAHQLYSPRLEYLGLAGVMSSFCREFGEQNGAEIDFKSDGLPSDVPPDITLCLFRVLQEALHNAVKHSGLRQFAGRLWATSDEIHLTVSDCGAGLDLETASKAGGLGLHRMKERLKLVKGSLSIDSQLKRGTTIHARVPLKDYVTSQVFTHLG